MKKILVVHYSQSGQLSEVVKHFTAPLVESSQVEVHFENICPVQDYPFPWPFFRFFDTFPEAVYLDPPMLQPSSLSGNENFDLVILAYQVWFLSPSLPVTGFLKSPVAAKLMNNKPIITLIACRNMWLMAQEEVKKLLNDLNANLIGNVALVDEAGSIGSFLATPAWVLTGNKGPRWGGFIPRAGVAKKEINNCDRFGQRIVDFCTTEKPLDKSILYGLGAVKVDEKLITSEKTARRGFLIWGKLFRKLGPSGSIARKPLLLIYACFLITFIVLFIPLSMLIKKLLSSVSRSHIAEQKRYYAEPSGEQTNATQ